MTSILFKFSSSPALRLFPLLTKQRIVIGPSFADSPLVDGADADLIINNNLIEIKCESPGFRATSVRQAIAYCLLDAFGEYDLKKCFIYLARFGTIASWDLEEITREVTRGRYGYKQLRHEFHMWLSLQEDLRKRKQASLEESQNRFSEQWQAMWVAMADLRDAPLFDDEARNRARAKWQEASVKLQLLEKESGLDRHRS